MFNPETAINFLDPRLPERFWSKVSVHPSGCWLWTSATSNGYGALTVGSRTDGSRRHVGAHRLAYEAAVGPVPDGLVIDHLCRTPLCVNPAHLEVVTQQQNVLRGVGPAAVNSARGTCVNGHALTDDNVTIRTKKNGRQARECLACVRRRSLARSAGSRA